MLWVAGGFVSLGLRLRNHAEEPIEAVKQTLSSECTRLLQMGGVELQFVKV